MVDDLDCDFTGGGFWEGAGGIASEGVPGGFIYFGSEGGFEGFVGVVGGTEKVGMADKEALIVVVGVYEPTGDFIWVAGAHFAGLGVKDIHSTDLYPDVAVIGWVDLDVGFTEDDEQVALAGVLEGIGHVEVGVHPGFEDGDAPQFGELGGVGIVVEGTGDDEVEVGISGFTGGGYEVIAGDGAKFGADEDSGSFLGFSFEVASFGADDGSRPGGEGGKGDFVVPVGLLHPGGSQVFQDDLGEVGGVVADDGGFPEFVVFVNH